MLNKTENIKSFIKVHHADIREYERNIGMISSKNELTTTISDNELYEV